MGDTCGMLSLPISPEQLAALPPDVRAVIEAIVRHYEDADCPAGSGTPGPAEDAVEFVVATRHAAPACQAGEAAVEVEEEHGGQSGHARHQRPLIPTDQCDDVVTLKPNECRRCGTELSGCDVAPLRHQVYELPGIKPLITEYQQHRLRCSGCGDTTCAALPAGAPRGQSGPKLIAFVALLMACFRQSKRRTALFVTSILNIPCCPSLTVKQQTIATRALQPAYEELVAALPHQSQLNGDESPTKEGPVKSWLWTFVANRFTVFALRGSRAATTLRELPGETFTGVMGCDRTRMDWQCGRLQWCWTHLKRDFQALIDSPDHQVKRLGHDLMRPTRALFRHWSRCRDGTITRRGFERLMQPIRDEIDSLLLRGFGTAADGMCRELRHHRDWLWTFLEVDGVEPTNNAAERSLRHAVIWRKLSFGTQSANGSRFVETLLTTIETCRQQHRSVFEFVTQTIEAHFHNRNTPSLLTDP